MYSGGKYGNVGFNQVTGIDYYHYGKPQHLHVPHHLDFYESGNDKYNNPGVYAVYSRPDGLNGRAPITKDMWNAAKKTNNAINSGFLGHYAQAHYNYEIQKERLGKAEYMCNINPAFCNQVDQQKMMIKEAKRYANQWKKYIQAPIASGYGARY